MDVFVVIMLSIIINSLFITEYAFFNQIDYFISDEKIYVGQIKNINEQVVSDRSLWFHYIKLIQFTDYEFGFFTKLASVPAIPLFVIYLSKVLQKESVLSFFLIFPYVIFLTQTVLRDIWIFTFVILLLYSFFNLKSYKRFLVVLLSSLSIVLLRPFFMAIIVLAICIALAAQWFNSAKIKSFRNILFQSSFFVLVTFILSFAFYFLFQNRVDSYFLLLQHINENGFYHADSQGVEASVSLSYFAYSTMKFIATPIPASLLNRMLYEPTTQFGLVDDLFRFISQTNLYISAFLLVVFFRRFLKNTLKDLLGSPTQLALTVFLFLTIILYAVYYGGGGHSRLKLPVYLLIYLFISSTFKKYRIKL